MSLFMVIGRIGSTELMLLVVIACVIIFGLKKKNKNTSTTSHSGAHSPITRAANAPQTGSTLHKQTFTPSASASQQTSTNEWVIQKTLKLFDEAVEMHDDAAAIIHGNVLIDNGKMMQVLVGMNKLSDAGYKDCTIMAANLTLQIAITLHGDRQAETSWYGMQCTEIKNALERIERDNLDVDEEVADLKENVAKIAEGLKYEYAYWQLVAYRECGDKRHRDLALRGLNDLSPSEKAEFYNENAALLRAVYGN